MNTFSRLYAVLFSLLAILQFATHVTVIGLDLSSVLIFLIHVMGVYILMASMNNWKGLRGWMVYSFSILFCALMFLNSGWILKKNPEILLGMLVLYGPLVFLMLFYQGKSLE